MADLMTFPDTVEEFMEKYKITDTEQIYTNGADLVPIFRMKQWFEHAADVVPSDGLTEEAKDLVRWMPGVVNSLAERLLKELETRILYGDET